MADECETACSKDDLLLWCSNCSGKNGVERRRAPHQLPCLHVLCDACLLIVVQKGCSCSICNVQFDRSKIGKNVLQSAESTAVLPSRCQASACLDGAPLAVVRCDVCKESLCEGCKQAHLRVTATRNHKLAMLPSSPPGCGFPCCTQHRNMPVVLYCTDCLVPICISCRQERHGQHSTCKIEDSFDRTAILFRKLLTELNVQISQMKGYDNVVNQRLAEVDAKETESQIVLKAAILQLQDCVIKRGQVLLDSLKKAAETKRKSYRDIQGATTRISVLLSQSKQMSESALKTGNPFTLIKAKAPVLEQYKMIEQFQQRRKQSLNNLQVPPNIEIKGLNTVEIGSKVESFGSVLLDKRLFNLDVSQMGARPSQMGERPPQISERPTQMGARPPQMGERPPQIGERPPQMSERPTQMGARPPQMGERPQQPRMNEQPPQMSERPAQIGARASQMVEKPPQVGERHPQVVERPPQMGETPLLPKPQMSDRPPQMGEKPPQMGEKLPQTQELTRGPQSSRNRPEVLISQLTTPQTIYIGGPNMTASRPLTSTQTQHSQMRSPQGRLPQSNFNHGTPSQGYPPPGPPNQISPSQGHPPPGHPNQISPSQGHPNHQRIPIPGNVPLGHPNHINNFQRPSDQRNPHLIQGNAPQTSISVRHQNPPQMVQSQMQRMQLAQRPATCQLSNRPATYPGSMVSLAQVRFVQSLQNSRNVMMSTGTPSSAANYPHFQASAPSSNCQYPRLPQVMGLPPLQRYPVRGPISPIRSPPISPSLAYQAPTGFKSPPLSPSATLEKGSNPNAMIKQSPSSSFIESFETATSEIDALVAARHAKDGGGSTPGSCNKRLGLRNLTPIEQSLHTNIDKVAEQPSTTVHSPTPSNSVPPTQTSGSTPVDDHERSKSVDDVKYQLDRTETRQSMPIPNLVLERVNEGFYNPIVNLVTPRRPVTSPCDDGRRDTPDASQVSSTGGKNNDEWEDYCAVCQNGCSPGEVLLCCSGCPKVYHIYCHVPNVPSVPKDEWFCTCCIRPEREVITQEASMQKRRKAGDLTNYERIMCEKLLLKLFVLQLSVPFREPVDRKFREYFAIIRHPMDLNTVRKRIDAAKNSSPKIKSVQRFLRELNQVFRNASRFNRPESEMADAARAVHHVYESAVPELFGSEYCKFVWKYEELYEEQLSEESDNNEEVEDHPGSSAKRRRLSGEGVPVAQE